MKIWTLIFLIAGLIVGVAFQKPWLAFVSRQADRGILDVVLKRTGMNEPLDDQLYFAASEIEFEKGELGTPQSAGGDWSNKRLDLLFGGKRNNFQLVQDLPPTARAQRLARGIGRIEIFVPSSGKVIPCTGTLISETHVLTAGHCFFDQETHKPVQNARAQLRLNQLDRNSTTETVVLGLKLPEIIDGNWANDPSGPEIVYSEDPGASRALGIDPLLDYAVLELQPGAFDCAVADAEPTNTAARQACIEKSGREAKAFSSKPHGIAPRPIDLGKVTLEPRHELIVLHHPTGKELVLTQRYCLAMISRDMVGNPDGSVRFSHLCDTLGGSSGAPVLSLDHEVVVGIHVCCQQINASETGGLNSAVRIEAVGARNKIVSDLIAPNPLNVRQQRVLDEVRQRSQDALAAVQNGQRTLARWLSRDAAQALLATDNYAQILAHDSSVYAAILASEEVGPSGFVETRSWIDQFGVDIDIGPSREWTGNSSLIRYLDLVTGEAVISRLSISEEATNLRELFRTKSSNITVNASGSAALVLDEENQRLDVWDLSLAHPESRSISLPSVWKSEEPKIYMAAFLADGAGYCVLGSDRRSENPGAPRPLFAQHFACVSGMANDSSQIQEIPLDAGEEAILFSEHWFSQFRENGVQYLPEDISRYVVIQNQTGTDLRVYDVLGRKRGRTFSQDDLGLLKAEARSQSEISWFVRSDEAIELPSGQAAITVLDPETYGIQVDQDTLVFGAQLLYKDVNAEERHDRTMGANIAVVLKLPSAADAEAHLGLAPVAYRGKFGSADWLSLYAPKAGHQSALVDSLDFAMNRLELQRWAESKSAETGQLVQDILLEELGNDFGFSRSGTVGETAAIAPDGSEVAIGYPDGEIWIWDAETGKNIDRLVSHADSVYAIRYTADGQHLISVGDAATLRIWTRIKANSPVRSELAGNSSLLQAEQDSQGGPGTSPNFGDVEVWAAPGKTSSIFAALIGPRAHEQHFLEVRDFQSDVRISELRSDAFDYITDVELAPDGELASVDGITYNLLWDISEQSSLDPSDILDAGRANLVDVVSSMLQGSSKSVKIGRGRFDVTAALWNSSGDRFVIAGSDNDAGRILVFDARSGECLFSAIMDPGGVATEFSDDGRLLAVGNSNGSAVLESEQGVVQYAYGAMRSSEPELEMLKGCEPVPLEPLTDDAYITSNLDAWSDAEFSVDGKYFVTASELRHSIEVHRIGCKSSGNRLCGSVKEPARIDAGYVRGVSMSAEGERLAYFNDSDEVVVVDLLSNSVLSRKSFKPFEVAGVTLDSAGAVVAVFFSDVPGVELHAADSGALISQDLSFAYGRASLPGDRILGYTPGQPLHILEYAARELAEVATERFDIVPDPNVCADYRLAC